VLNCDVQSSKYSRYSCGWPSQFALTLNPIEGFETTSKQYSETIAKKAVLQRLSQPSYTSNDRKQNVEKNG
jgi:hypothetical protein